MTLKWLVSCKHYASSDRSVSDSDEINISDRLKQHGCDGFMGVYSTLPATSLTGVLKGQKYHCVFDRERIESILLSHPGGLKITARYFPESYKKYFLENQCDACKKNLLDQGVGGFFLQMSKSKGEKIDDVAFVCAGYCDSRIPQQLGKKGYGDVGSWEISDLTSPALWIEILMHFIEDIQGHLYSDEACEKMWLMFIRTFPYIARHLTQKEQERIHDLMQLTRSKNKAC